MGDITLDVKLPKLPSWADNPSAVVQSMLEASARAMSNTLRKHFREKNRTPNAKGWRRSNYWSQVGESVTTRVEGESAIAEIRKEGVWLRWKGGTVRPKPGHKALAIPADRSVAGVWPSEYRGVKTFLLWRKGENRGFIAKSEKGRKEPRVLWWLVSKTEHKPDPTVVPETTVMQEAVQRACRSVLRQLEGGAG